MSVVPRRIAFSPFLPMCESLPVSGGGPSLESAQPTLPLPRPFLQPVCLPKKVIVIVDDSLTVRKILEICLRREGFEVKAFGDGMAFLRWLATAATTHSCLPDLLLLDVMLPKLDGYAIAQHVKARSAFPHTALVFLSSKDGILDRLKGRLLGASGYLTKPFRTQEVVAMAKAVLSDS